MMIFRDFSRDFFGHLFQNVYLHASLFCIEGKFKILLEILRQYRVGPFFFNKTLKYKKKLISLILN